MRREEEEKEEESIEKEGEKGEARRGTRMKKRGKRWRVGEAEVMARG
jgi:hypothetical protein